MKHRVAVTVSEPDHPAVTMRKEQKQKFVRVTASSQDEAIAKAKAHYKKQGYKVHGAEYHSEIKEEVELDEAQSYQHHVVSKLEGNVLASYKTKEEAHKNAHGNPVVSGDLETIGDKHYVKESQQIDEITKQTLGSYIKKASKDASGRATAAMHTKNIAKDLRKVGAHDMADTYDDESFKATEKQIKRQQGIQKAVDRLTKEEAEQVDELNRSTVRSYLYKAQDTLKAAAKTHPTMVKKRVAGSMKAIDRLKKEESEVEEGYVSDAQRKAVWAARDDEKEAKKKKLKETKSFAEYSESCDKMSKLKKAVKKIKEEVQEFPQVEEEVEVEVEDLQEATFAYHVKKAEAAKSRNDDKKFSYHMENARTARYAMTGKEMIRNRHHLDKYNDLRK